MNRYLLFIALSATCAIGAAQQNVGIGTNNPASKLSIDGNAAIGSSSFITTAAPANGLLIEGNVGIGTLTPTTKLHVVGNAQVTGTLKIGAYTMPATDGAANYVLKTDGAGNVSWTVPTSGTTGPTGGTGPQGSQGIQGPQGNVGPQGPAGPQGLQGNAGAQGPAGAIGPQGPQGPQGNVGPQGSAGAVGPAGPQGLQGNAGAQGPAGAVGPAGPQGPQGLQGNAGPQGAQGPAGAQGAQGPQGSAGAQGPAGPQGAQGPQGLLTSGSAAGNTTYWNGSTWVTNSSNIYNNGGNVGIGTNNPQAKMHITTANPSGNGVPAGGLLWIGGKNDNPNDQYITFRNPSVTDESVPGMAWWSSDITFGRFKNEAFWGFKETHGSPLGSAHKDIMRAYVSDAGGYQNLNKLVLAPNAGNVGIATTDPLTKLHVNGSFRANCRICLYYCDGNCNVHTSATKRCTEMTPGSISPRLDFTGDVDSNDDMWIGFECD